ncbi:hypothetical protein LH408_12445 [Enterobacter cloacae]|uniref:AAA family ATPase n=1 Tax=Enterobacter cloacae TaxID=550 RepID=UPI001D020A00|nr:AAA family ATPase [Enterobacter cloacae]UDF98915.1 hypothetical protein LH408_12445 [Enterobacter cloacae]
MSKIMAVRIHEHFIELIPSNAERYGPLFEIDSVSLLLGTNGSGKTRILTSLANAVASSQDESFQFYFKGTPNGDYEPTSPYNDKLCSVYYSALPYKRKLLRRKGIINASPNGRVSTDNKRLEEFGMISKTLEIQAELIGNVSYSRLVFRTILIPAIRHSENVISTELNHLITELEEISSGNPLKLEDHIVKDKKREFLLSHIETLIEDIIFSKCGLDDGLLFLSSLEYLHIKAGEGYSKVVALDFLKYIGLVKSPSSFSNDFALQELLIVVKNTKRLMEQYCSFENRKRSHRTLEFRIENMDVSEKIKNIDTSIKIEWSNQSSGLQALVEQFSLIDNAIGKASNKNYKSVLLLIDEGDAYLHMDWQRKYISILNKYLGGLKRKYKLQNLQLVMATHSPLLAADIPGDFVTSLNSDTFSSTFAAPIEEVIANAFSSNSLGEFAAKNINEIYNRAILGKTTTYDRNLVDSIGDVSIKNILKKSINNDN